MSTRALALLAIASAVSACSSPAPAPPALTPAHPAQNPPLVVAAPDAGAGPDAADNASTSGARVANENEARRIAKMLKKVSAARHLTPKSAVPGVTVDRAGLLQRVKVHVDREVPKEAIRNEGLAMKVLGLIPTNFDYEKETYALLEAQLAGYYEPADHTMYMAADLDEDNARATLAHELVHALQDQYWDLATRSKYRHGQGDFSAVTSALAEGDATSTMFDVILSGTGRTALDLPEEIFTKQILASVSTGASAKSPHAMRAALVAPYVNGTIFIHELRRRGGWELVDKAWARPPVTTEQLLHVKKWEANEPALDVAPPRYTTLGAGFTELDVDIFGELGTRLTFAEWMDEGKAIESAARWGGDRAVLLQRGDDIALGWRIEFDDTKAETAFSAVVAAIDARTGRPKKKGAGFACFARSELGPLAFWAKGRTLVIVAGPTKSAAQGAWAPAGDCPTSEKWAKEIAAP